LDAEYFKLSIAIFYGLCIGSFLNVCIYRVPRKISVLSPARSFCPNCEKQITWFENIPVFSWLFLRGKCSNCSQAIAFRYPFVEILSGLAAFGCYYKFGVNLSSVLLYLLVATLIVVTFIDFDFKIIPNRITFPGMTIGLLMGGAAELLGSPFLRPLTSGAIDSLIGFLVGGLFFFIIGEVYYRLSGAVGLGGGDIKLTAMTGAILGYESLAPTIFGGSLLGSVFGLCMMAFTKSGRKTEIAFGPWLAIGTILYIYGGFTLFPFFKIF